MVTQRPNRRRGEVLLLGIAFALAGCGCSATATPGSPAGVSEEEILRGHVQVVEVRYNGGAPTYSPDPVKVKKNEQIVVWVVDQGVLNISFADDPFEGGVRCGGGRFCAALRPPPDSIKTGLYPYEVTVRVGEQSASIDPSVEVIDN